MKLEIVDYRKLRPNNINSDQFKHLWLLLFWPIFGIMFMGVERLGFNSGYTPVYCPLDDRIPFCELFVIPYLFWFVYLTGVVVFTLFFDTEAFRRVMKFIIITYTITILIYLIWPTCQELRPENFERDNFLTRFMAGFYQFDTNTNVFPSLHVIGSAAAMFGFCDTKYIKTTGWKVGNVVVTVLISLSTVFLKQHSVLDVFGAIPVCLVAWYAVYCPGNVFEKAADHFAWRKREVQDV